MDWQSFEHHIGLWTFAYTLVTFGLAVSAVAAARAAFAQLKLLRAQTEAAERSAKAAFEVSDRVRQGSIKPVLAFQRAALLQIDGSRRFVEVRIRNAGVGPAIDTELQAWVEPIPGDVMENFSARISEFASQATERVARREPELHAKQHLIAPADEVPIYLKSNHRSDVDLQGATAALVFLNTRFTDIDHNAHAYPTASTPSKIGYIWRIARLEDRPPELQ